MLSKTKAITVKFDPTETYFKRIFKQRDNADRKFMIAREKLKKAKKWMAICKDDFTDAANALLHGAYDVDSERDGSVRSAEWE